MGLRGPKAKSAAWHLARGTYRRDRHGPRPTPAAKPELVYSAPEATDGLNAGQAALLRARPKGLPRRQALHYGELVRLAPWLEPGDRALLTIYVETWDAYSIAEKELGHLLKDPSFADPASEVAKAGLLYNRIVHRKATLLLQAARLLGFTPAGRAALGIETGVRKKQATDVDDPWARLRLLPGGKGEPPGPKD
jgi:phage terminase small subunit